MRNFASTLVKFSKLSHIQTTIWRPPKMAPPRTAGSAGPFVTPLFKLLTLDVCDLQHTQGVLYGTRDLNPANFQNWVTVSITFSVESGN